MKKAFRKWHDAGLEVVGLSLDTDPKAAAAAAKQYEIPWRIVIAPFTDDARQLWTEASRIESIPRLLLIDQRGILRADLTSAQKLEEAVADLMGRNLTY